MSKRREARAQALKQAKPHDENISARERWKQYSQCAQCGKDIDYDIFAPEHQGELPPYYCTNCQQLNIHNTRHE